MGKSLLSKIDKHTVAKVRARAQTLSPDFTQADAVIAAMLQDGDALLNRGHLLARLKEFGIAGTSWWKGLDNYADWRNDNLLGPQQIPTEIVDYLLFAAARGPKDALEIGVSYGGTTAFSAAFFQAINPEFTYHCLDIKDKTKLSPAMRDMLNIQMHIPATSDDLAGQQFDVVFIDGDHSYDWAKRDFENIGRNARLVCAFHDINGKEYIPQGGGVFRYWRELRATVSREAPMLDICHAVPGEHVSKDGLWMGIGLIDYASRHDPV